MRIAAGILLMVAALTGAVSPARAAMMHPLPGGHGPPDVRFLYICRVLPRYGDGFCTAPPYAPSASAAPARARTGRGWVWWSTGEGRLPVV